jgi:hypothetical protein
MAIYMRIATLAFQGLIVAGVFWVGATFTRKTDFEAYKKEQELRRVEDLRSEYQRSELLTRLEERLRAFQESEKGRK